MELNIITESTSAPLGISYADAGLFLWSSHEMEVRKQIKEYDKKYFENMEIYLKFKNDLYDKFYKKVEKQLASFKEKLAVFNTNITMLIVRLSDKEYWYHERQVFEIIFINELMFDKDRKDEYSDEEWESLTSEQQEVVRRQYAFGRNSGAEEYCKETFFKFLFNDDVDKYEKISSKDYKSIVAKKEELLDGDKTVRANLEKQITDKAKQEFMNNVNIASTEVQINKNPDLLKQIAEIAANVMNRMGAEGTKLIG
jgi:hypothetical protein